MAGRYRSQAFCSYCASPAPAAAVDECDTCRSCKQGTIFSTPWGPGPRPDDAFLIVGLDLTIRAISRAAEALLSAPRGEVVDAPLSRLLQPAHPVTDAEKLAQAIGLAVAGAAVVDRLLLHSPADPARRFNCRLTGCGPPGTALVTLTALIASGASKQRPRRPAGEARRETGRQADSAGLSPLMRNLGRTLDCAVTAFWRDGRSGDGPVPVGAWTAPGADAGLLEVIGPRHRPADAGAPETFIECTGAGEARRAGLTHVARMPVMASDGVCGTLLAGFTAEPQDASTVCWVMESFAALTSLCLNVPEALDGVRGGARHDSLTGCLTYRSTRHELAREINRSSRNALELSVCFIDLDDFKSVNELHGHLCGNVVLERVARSLCEGVRSCDTVGRYGGDEFIAILPETDEESARALAARLVELVGESAVAPLGRRVSASIGVAQWTADASEEQLLERADRALFTAKQRGGGVVTASEAQV